MNRAVGHSVEAPEAKTNKYRRLAEPSGWIAFVAIVWGVLVLGSGAAPWAASIRDRQQESGVDDGLGAYGGATSVRALASAIFRWGDVDGSDTVTALDAAYVLRYDAFLIDSFPCCPEVRPQVPLRGDVSHGIGGVNSVDALDAALILRFDAFLIDHFPADTDQDGFGPEAPTPTATATPTNTTFSTPTPSATPGLTPPAELTVMLPGNVPLVMVLIPAGSFEMGSTDDLTWSGCPPCEQPVHTVTIAQPFYMGKYEVTQRQWQAVMGNNPSFFTNRLDAPVENVTWYDCQDFITALNEHIAATGQGPATFRLPSEAEWEYACRAGTTTRFSFGDSTCPPRYTCILCELSVFAWWCGNNNTDWWDVNNPLWGTKAVGLRAPNAWGLHDMHGNVHEWCEDYWYWDYIGAPTDGSAWLGPLRPFRVIRGGSWRDDASYCRSAHRLNYSPISGNFDLGFRLARP